MVDGPGRISKNSKEVDPQSVGLPVRVVLYTLDQISAFIEVPVKSLESDYIYFDGRTLGVPPTTQMVARNVAPPTSKAEWRVAEQEFIRWMKRKGFKFYRRDSLSY